MKIKGKRVGEEVVKAEIEDNDNANLPKYYQDHEPLRTVSAFWCCSLRISFLFSSNRMAVLFRKISLSFAMFLAQ